LIDQQYLWLLTMRSYDATLVTNAMSLLAKGARLFGVRTLLTTAFAERQALIKDVQAVFPDETLRGRAGRRLGGADRFEKSWSWRACGPKAAWPCPVRRRLAGPPSFERRMRPEACPPAQKTRKRAGETPADQGSLGAQAHFDFAVHLVGATIPIS
jgi:hypothetical protein